MSSFPTYFEAFDYQQMLSDYPLGEDMLSCFQGMSREALRELQNQRFMQVVDRCSIKLRVFERGVGETEACGTGACAAVVSGRLRGLLDEKVTVELPGGELEIGWAGEGQAVIMKGPATFVFEGTIRL